MGKEAIGKRHKGQGIRYKVQGTRKVQETSGNGRQKQERISGKTTVYQVRSMKRSDLSIVHTARITFPNFSIHPIQVLSILPGHAIGRSQNIPDRFFSLDRPAFDDRDQVS